MKKIIASILVVCLVMVGGLVVYFYYLSPESKAKRSADAFMQQLLANDTGATSRYLSDSPANVYQRNYSHVSSTESKNNFYILYRFTDTGAPSQIRIQVTESAIKAVTIGSKLGKIPSQDKEETVLTSEGEAQCLSRSDLEYIDSRRIYARYIRGATMIFQPNSTDFQTEQGGGLLLDRMASFYKKTNEKDYAYELKGYMASGALSPDERQRLDDLFQRRAVTLQEGLNSRGIPLDRISVSPVYNYYDTSSTTLDNYLYVDINIVNRCIDA